MFLLCIDSCYTYLSNSIGPVTFDYKLTLKFEKIRQFIRIYCNAEKEKF